MAQITIKTSKEHRCNKSVIIATYDVKFDNFGMAEVPERYLEGILKSDPSISLVDDTDVKKYQEIKKESNSKKEVSNIDIIDENSKLKIEVDGLKQLNKKLEEEKVALNSELVEANETILKLNEAIDALQGEEKDLVDINTEGNKEDKDSEFDIDAMKKAELQELCKGLELPTEEWENLKIDDLKVYVKEKIENTEE